MRAVVLIAAVLAVFATAIVLPATAEAGSSVEVFERNRPFLLGKDDVAAQHAAEVISKLGVEALPQLHALAKDWQIAEDMYDPRNSSSNAIASAFALIAAGDAGIWESWLADPSPAVHACAVWALGFCLRNEDAPAEIEALLLPLLEDPDPRLRALACSAMGSLTAPSDTAVLALVGRLADGEHALLPFHYSENLTVAQWASQSLWREGLLSQRQELVLPALLALLSDAANPVAQSSALHELRLLPGALESAELRRLVVALTDSPDEDLRAAAISACGDFAEADPAAMRAILDHLRDPGWLCNYYAYLALGDIPELGGSAKRAMLEALNDPANEAPEYMLWELSKRWPDDQRVLKAAIPLLDRAGYNSLASNAAVELLALHYRDLDGLCSRLAADADANRRTAALQIIGKAKHASPVALNILSALLQDPESGIAEDACEAAAELGPAASALLPQLSARMQSLDLGLRTAALLASARIGEDADTRSLLLQACESGRYAWYDVMAVLEALRQRGVDSELIALLDRLNCSPDQDLRYVSLSVACPLAPQSPEALALIYRNAEDSYSSCRMRAADALGDRGIATDRSADILLALLRDPDSFVRKAACESLGKLGKLNDDVEPALLLAASDPDEDVGRRAARALCRLHGLTPAEQYSFIPGIDWND